MRQTMRAICAATLFAATSTTAAEAATIVSFNRATFQAAIAGATSLGVQNFDGLSAGSTLNYDGFVNSSASAGLPLVTSVFLTSSGANGLGRTGVGFFEAGDTATFVFDMPVTAFAIDVNTFAQAAGAYQALTSGGDTADSIFESFPGVGTGQFIGFTSSEAFSSVTVRSTGTFAYSLDTLIYGSAEAVSVVPEPATWAMMIVGFGMVGGAMRTRRRRAKISYG